MAISDLILQLQHATGPSRDLDISIGIIMGYKRQVKVPDETVKGQAERKVVWIFEPNGRESEMPEFTGKIDDAYLLADNLIPDCIGGISWDGRGGTAKLNDGPYFTASTPALALCIAALSVKHYQEIDNR